MSLPLPALDTLTGCILIGTWASSLLYMVEIVQSVYYFQHFAHDDWKFKTLVTVALVVDSLSLIGDYICIYEYTVTHAVNWMLSGDLEYLATVHWVRQVDIIPCLGIIISFGSVCTTSLMITVYTSLEDREKFRIPIAVWLLTEVAVDAGIASVLVWEFRKARGILTETRGALDRLTAVTIQSGAAAATLAGAGLMGYYIQQESNLALVFLYPLARVYVITLIGALLTMPQLSNLNVRKSGKPFTATGTHSGLGAPSGERGPPTLTGWATDDPCGIRATGDVKVPGFHGAKSI
ncbi:hypothetical protein C8R45DRAFT_1084233 [Mycena sanguinolenta]|nr:hypothetical protein C8R45DRAFT_1084233 [Mycena sanguinolenta]